jgi:hypothetical protein
VEKLPGKNGISKPKILFNLIGGESYEQRQRED